MKRPVIAGGVAYISIAAMVGAGVLSGQDLPRPQHAERRLTLAPGGCQRLSGTGLTVCFEAVVEDSRCPIGVTCVWAGDVAIRIRIERPKSKPVRHVLRLLAESAREAEADGVTVRLIDVTPQPGASDKPRRDAYRVSLSFKRK